MSILRFSIATAFALSWPILTMGMVRRQQRNRTADQPSYEKLRTERDTLFFSFGFFVFWVMLAAPKLDWTFAGEFTGAVVAFALIAVSHIAKLILRRLNRPAKP